MSLLSSLTASALMVAAPASTLALGLGLGSEQMATVTLAASNSSVGAEADVRLEARAENRCKHLSSDDDRARCLALVKLQLGASGDASVRASHGKFMSGLHARIRETQRESREVMSQVHKFIKTFLTQFHTALQLEAKTALTVCQDKTEAAARKQCIVDAQAKLQTKVNAALDVLKK